MTEEQLEKLKLVLVDIVSPGVCITGRIEGVSVTEFFVCLTNFNGPYYKFNVISNEVKSSDR